MMNKDDFKPADGVTLENCFRYIEAIEQAAKRDIFLLKTEDRSTSLSIIAGTLKLVADQITKFRRQLEENGEATPMSDEQRLLLRAIMLRAVKPNNEN